MEIDVSGCSVIGAPCFAFLQGSKLYVMFCDETFLHILHPSSFHVRRLSFEENVIGIYISSVCKTVVPSEKTRLL